MGLGWIIDPKTKGGHMKPPLIGQMVFDLSGELANTEFGIEFQCILPEPKFHPGMNNGYVLVHAWPLFLESQIGKIPRSNQPAILGTIVSQALKFIDDGTLPPITSSRPEYHHLATVNVDLNAGKKIFVIVNGKFSGISATEATTQMLTYSLANVAHDLDPQQCGLLMFFLVYGIRKWHLKGLPGLFSAFKQTWDFGNINGMMAEYKSWQSRG
jgi:hypothetical protein